MHKLKATEYNARKAAKEAAKIAKAAAKDKPNNAASLKERIDALEELLGIE